MDNPDKLTTQDTGRRPTKQWTIQINWQQVYLDCPLCCLSSSCVLCCQFIWIVHYFVCLRHVSCVASLSGLSIALLVFVLCLVLPVYLDCPLCCLSSSCVLCCQFIWIVHYFVCLGPVSCVASLSGLSIVLFVFVMCLVFPVHLDCPLCCLSSSTGRRQTTQWTIQINWQHKTQDEDKQSNGQSR
jgi:hypothetical protein